MSWSDLIFVLFLSQLCGYITAHPQCLDFRAPFENETPLSFCSEYTDFGCCSLEMDSEIQLEYQRIRTQVSANGILGCDQYLRDILCQRCSPYAAHIYDAEASGSVDRTFPGLCSGYCSQFYDSCKDIVKWLTNDTTITNAINIDSKPRFCDTVAVPDVVYCFPELLTNDVLNQEIVREQRTEPGCLCLEEFAQGLGNPLTFRTPPGSNDERIFVGEQVGIIHIYFRNKTRLETPFMDIQDLVLTSSRNGDERGFLGMAFHPRFHETQKIYVFFSTRREDGEGIRISEFAVNTSNSNLVNRSSERILLEVSEPFGNHNGGEILFGEDNFLYAFIGDGGAGGDPYNYAQNTETLLGKVIRIDVDKRDAARGLQYAIPDDNPFKNSTRSRHEIYAYGIRNIWRCDVDDGHPDTGYGRGRIICGDVGQSSYEEIDIIQLGGNYGWNSREGFACYRDSTCGKIGPEVLPIFAYGHSQGRSVTGGHVYRGCANPNLQGQYFYGDFSVGRIWSLTENIQTGQWSNREIHMCGRDVCFNGLTGEYQNNILSFGEDQDGEIYMLTTDFASPTSKIGKIYKFVDPKRRGDPTKCRTYKPPPTTTTTTTSTSTSTEKTTTPEPVKTTQEYPFRGIKIPRVEYKCGNVIGYKPGCSWATCLPTKLWHCWPVVHWVPR